MRADITVHLRAGIYRLSAPLALGAQDSGTNGHTIIWTASPGQTAVIGGSVRVSGWKATGRSGIWEARVPSDLNTRQIFVNGQRATLASGPLPTKLMLTSSGYRASSSVMAHWRNPSQIDFVYTQQGGLMVEPICPIASIHGTTITMAQPCWDNSNKRKDNIVGFGHLGQPSYVENAFELLNKPGQFYLDRGARKLYYIPFAGQNMKTADVETPLIQTLVSGSGTAGNPIHDITFSNLQFSYATWMQPSSPTGFSDMQDGYTITGNGGYATQGLCQVAPGGTCPFGDWTREPGNVTFAYDHSIAFSDDRFVHLGAAGLNLDNGSQNDTVSGSVFTDISGNGLQIGGVDMPTASGNAQTAGVNVTENYLHGLPVEYHGGVAILVGYARNTLIAHNQIDHVPYSAISLGWGGWPDKRSMPPTANYSRDNVVSDNLIHDFMETLSDGGAVYTLGITGSSMASGQKVTGNVIYNQLAWGRALQSDDGATYVTYKGNALYDDNYDWGTTHLDYRYHDGRYDATSVTGNYWQQGDPSTTVKGVVIAGNTLVPGGQGVPASVMRTAGLQGSFRALLNWSAAGEDHPMAPYSVAVLYGVGSKAYVTWRPSYAYGANAVTSYKIAACPAANGLARTACNPAGSTTISRSAFEKRGYAVVARLHSGSRYSFTIYAESSSGASTPSIPSSPVTVGTKAPAVPGAPKSLDAKGGSHLVRLIWYAPDSSTTNPVLGYTVAQPGGHKYEVTGLRPLIVSNSGGRVVFVVPNLQTGKSYRFSVSALDPSGSGPQAQFPAVKATR